MYKFSKSEGSAKVLSVVRAVAHVQLPARISHEAAVAVLVGDVKEVVRDRLQHDFRTYASAGEAVFVAVHALACAELVTGNTYQRSRAQENNGKLDADHIRNDHFEFLEDKFTTLGLRRAREEYLEYLELVRSREERGKWVNGRLHMYALVGMVLAKCGRVDALRCASSLLGINGPAANWKHRFGNGARAKRNCNSGSDALRTYLAARENAAIAQFRIVERDGREGERKCVAEAYMGDIFVDCGEGGTAQDARDNLLEKLPPVA